MTETLLPSVVSLIILGLLLTVIVRKTRLSLVAGILLTVIPVAAGNLWWFYAYKPQHDAELLAQHSLAELSALPGYRVLKQQEPKLWAVLQQSFLHSISQGMSMPLAVGQLRGMLADVVNQRIGRASDQAVINYVTVNVDEMIALEKISPEYCFRFLYPQVEGGVNLMQVLPPSLNDRDSVAMEQLLLTSEGPDKPLNKTLASDTLKQVVGTLYSRWGDKLKQLNEPGDTSSDHQSLCAMTIDLYQTILKLPAPQSANLLRMMVVSAE